MIFSLTIISITVSYVYFAEYKWNPNVGVDQYDKATIASNVISFFAQLVQIWILAHFTEANEDSQDSDLP